MTGCSVLSLFLVVGLSLPAFGTDGVFQGRVVDPPPNQPVTSGWIYIQGRNHALRRVEVSHAAIVFAHDVPESERHKCGTECLIAGQEIRVTAEQDSAGEWRAKRIEILKPAKPAKESEAVQRSSA
jgi:hypothetical protein